MVCQRYATTFLSDLHEVAAYQSGMEMAMLPLLFRGYELYSNGTVQRSADNWQAYLMVETVEGASVVGRFESHGSHPGVHGHAHCERSGIEVGASGLDNLARCPPADTIHRRTNAWTESTFWEAARSFFRVREANLPSFE